MNLENIVGMYKSRVEPILENAPWWAKFVYGTEIKSIKKVAAETESNLKVKNKDVDWYLKQGDLINEGFSSVYSAVNKTYNIYAVAKPIYNVAKHIPFVGGYVEKKVAPVKAKLKEYNINRIPKKEEALGLVSKTYDAAMSAYCLTASVQTGVDYEFFRSRLHKDITVKKTKDPFDYVLNAVSSVVNAFGSIFGGNYKTT